MGRPPKYPEEFRRDAVELVRTSGRSIVDVATSLGITDSTLHNWLKADREARERANDPEALTASERAEFVSFFERFEVFYNRQRHQTALGHRTPAGYAATFNAP